MVGRIPIYCAYASSGVTAEEYVWTILEVKDTVWVGYSAGTIRVFSASPSHKNSAGEDQFELLTLLNYHVGGVYNLRIWVRLSCTLTYTCFIFAFIYAALSFCELLLRSFLSFLGGLRLQLLERFYCSTMGRRDMRIYPNVRRAYKSCSLHNFLRGKCALLVSLS